MTLLCAEVENDCPEPLFTSRGITWMMQSLIYGSIERQVVYIERVYRGDSLKSDGH